MTLLVFGKTGQVAQALALLHPDAQFLDRLETDLSDPDACAEQISKSDARAVINAAAYTDVDGAEADETYQYQVNAAAPQAMAKAAAAKDIPFVTLSTDYVFNGQGSRPWLPTDAPDPLNAYGHSKLAAEQAVQAAGGRYAVLRTSWVFSAKGSNFVSTVLRLTETQDQIDIVADQSGGPTPADALAGALIAVSEVLAVDKNASGIYHFCGKPDVSRADFAREICRQAGRNTVINDITTRKLHSPAERPLNSRLDCATTTKVFGLAQPDWHAGLKSVLEQLGVRK